MCKLLNEINEKDETDVIQCDRIVRGERERQCPERYTMEESATVCSWQNVCLKDVLSLSHIHGFCKWLNEIEEKEESACKSLWQGVREW